MNLEKMNPFKKEVPLFAAFSILFSLSSSAQTSSYDQQHSFREGTVDPNLVPVRSDRSQEWRTLPTQRWQTETIFTRKNVDRFGIDQASVLKRRDPTGIQLAVFATTEKIKPVGEIVSSRKAASYISLADTVFIEPLTDLEIGTTYSVINPPVAIRSVDSDRTGYEYFNAGSVKILADRDGLYVGTLTSSHEPIQRGAFLIPKLEEIKNVNPIPGPQAMEGIILLDDMYSAWATVQNKTVFIDRGTEDGVKPGMVFRAYQYHDPSNDRKITGVDMIVDGDFMCVYVTENFCTAVALHSFNPIYEQTMVVLLTDVSDVKDQVQFTNKAPKRASDFDSERADEIDDGLTDPEKRELEQLERWKGNRGSPSKGSSTEYDSELDDLSSKKPRKENVDLPPEAKDSAPETDLNLPPNEVSPETPSGRKGIAPQDAPSSSDEQPPADRPAEDQALDQL